MRRYGRVAVWLRNRRAVRWARNRLALGASLLALAMLVNLSLVSLADHGEPEPDPPGSLAVNKVWEEGDEPLPGAVEITVTGLDNGESQTRTLNDNNGWSDTWENLTPGEYEISESFPGDGWSVAYDPGSTVSVQSDLTTEVTVTNTHDSFNGGDDPGDPGTGSLTVNKVWEEGDEDVPVEVEIKVTGPDNGESQTEELNADNEWTHTWEDLTPGDYEISEETLGGDWSVSYEPDSPVSVNSGEETVVTVTNTHDSFNGGDEPGDPAGAARITSVVMKIDGEEVDENTEQPVDQDSTLSLFYTWEIDDDAVDIEGTSIQVEVPVGFRIANDVSGPLLADDGTAGTFLLDSDTRMLTLTFNDYYQTRTGVNGTVEINTRFELEVIPGTDNPVEFEFELSEDVIKTIALKFKPDANFAAVKKRGEADQAVNPGRINWSIDVNKSLEPLQEAEVLDTIGEGQSLDSDSLKVYRLAVGLDGSLSLGPELAESEYDFQDNNGSFTLDLGSITTAYRITYSTDIEDKSQSEFRNVAAIGPNSSEASVAVEWGPDLAKEGEADKGFNPGEITWTIQANLAERDMVNARVEDEIPEGLSLEAGSVKVYELSLDGAGNVESETDVTDNYSPVVDGNSFSVTLGEIDKAYKIEYVTQIDDDTVTVFSNQARLFDGEDEIATVTAEVPVTRGVLLDKDGQATINYNEKYIEWTIDVNTREEIIDDAIVTDSIGPGVELDQDSIRVYELTFDDEGAVLNEDLLDPQPVIDPLGDDGFTVNLGDIDGARRIKYRTEITDVNQATFANEATLAGDGVTIGIGDQITATKTLSPTIANRVTKSSQGINYADKTMEWRIRIRPIKEPMKNLVIEDTFPNGGLSLKPETVVVRAGGTELTLDEHYTLEARGTGGFRLEFLNDVEGADYTITFKTDFDRAWRNPDDDNPTDYINRVHAEWEEDTLPGEQQNAPDSATRQISDTAARNGNKSGTLRRTDREIDWEININYLSEDYTNLTVTDDILGNQELLTDTLEVYHYTLEPNGDMIRGAPVDPAQYDVLEKSPGRFVIRFSGESDSPYRITYTTALTGQSQDQYVNTAEVGDTDLTATVGFADSEVFVDKSGLQAGWFVDWEIEVNTSLSTIRDAVLEDTLSPGHEYVENSLSVYRMMPDPVLVDPEEYDFSITILDFETREQSFELRFKDTLTDQYVIEYQTEITTEVDGTEIDNLLRLSGTGVEIENDSTSQTLAVEITAGMGTAEGRTPRGSLEITKVDGDDPEVKLSGAVFRLLNAEGQLLGVLPATDEDGQVVVEGMSYGNYFIRESQPPAGYQPQSDEIIGVIIDSEETSVTIENFQYRSLIITKVDEEDETRGLAGGEFVLKDAADNPVATVTTDSEGRARIDGLHFGDYTLSETESPDGYDATEETIPVSIDQVDLEHELVVTNAKTPVPGDNGETPSPTPPPGGNGEAPEQGPETPEDDGDPEDTEAPGDDRDPDDTDRPEDGQDPDVPDRPEDTRDPAEDTDAPEDSVVRETTTEDTSVDGQVEVPDGSKAELGEPPQNGTVVVDEDGNWTYIPDPGYTGEDSFTIVITHPDGSQEEVRVEVDVKGFVGEDGETEGEGWTADDMPLPREMPFRGELPFTGGSLLGVTLAALALVAVGSGLRRRH